MHMYIYIHLFVFFCSYYLNEGFMQLQRIVEESIMEMLTNESIDIDVQVRVGQLCM